MVSGVAIGRSSVATSRLPMPATDGGPTTSASPGRSANGRFQLSALRNDATSPSRVSGNSTLTRAPGGRVPVNEVASVISSMGVMPAIGSFEKLPSAYDTAPIKRPSM